MDGEQGSMDDDEQKGVIDLSLIYRTSRSHFTGINRSVQNEMLEPNRIFVHVPPGRYTRRNISSKPISFFPPRTCPAGVKGWPEVSFGFSEVVERSRVVCARAWIAARLNRVQLAELARAKALLVHIYSMLSLSHSVLTNRKSTTTSSLIIRNHFLIIAAPQSVLE